MKVLLGNTTAGRRGFAPRVVKYSLRPADRQQALLDASVNAGTNNAGHCIYALWAAHGESEPVEIAFKWVDFTVFAPDLLSAQSVITHDSGQNSIQHAVAIGTNSNAASPTNRANHIGISDDGHRHVHPSTNARTLPLND